MAPTGTTDRTVFWQDHVTTWQASNLTQKAYCEAHGLRYSTFGYWVRKLRTPSEDPRESASGFVSVTMAPADGGLVLALPNGLEIRGIEANHLGLVRDLLGMLA